MDRPKKEFCPTPNRDEGGAEFKNKIRTCLEFGVGLIPGTHYFFIKKASKVCPKSFFLNRDNLQAKPLLIITFSLDNTTDDISPRFISQDLCILKNRPLSYTSYSKVPIFLLTTIGLSSFT